jgi:acetyl esterase/lipase
MPAAAIRRRELTVWVPRGIRRQLHYDQLEIGGVAAECITPRTPTDHPVLLYFHGGGYNVCSPATHRGLASRIALATTARVVVPDYRLAPEHPHPAALEDALAVYRALLTAGTRPEQMVIAGDSAGGGLSLATLVSLRDAGEPLPAAAVLLSPWVDLTLSGASLDAHEASDYCWRRALEVYASNYLSGLDPCHPLASPLYADPTGLPPLLIQAGGSETLLDDSRAYVEHARAAGVEVEFEINEGSIHVFQAFAPMVPGSTAAIARIGEFVQRQLG